MRSRLYVFALALLVWVLDAVSKQYALHALANGQSIQIVGNLLKLQLTANSGAAFSVGTSVTWLFTILAAVVVVGILIMAPVVTSRAWLTGLGGLMGGAAGNLTDRLTRPPSFGLGHVVDFIATPHFPIFNLADSAIVCSVVLMFIVSARGIPFSDHDGARHE